MVDIIKAIALEGHDSELYGCLTEDQCHWLESHPAANQALWTFGGVESSRLFSICQWNGDPGCFALLERPDVTETGDGFIHWGSFVCRAHVICISALAFVRYEFMQFYASVALNNWMWIRHPADPHLHRLAYVRGYGGKSTDDPQWQQLRDGYYLWAEDGLTFVRDVVRRIQ